MPEDGADFDPGNCKPAFEGQDRAVAAPAEADATLRPSPFLVRLGAPEREHAPSQALDVDRRTLPLRFPR